MGADETMDRMPLETSSVRLRRARVAAGLSRAEVALATRIPERHLAAIDRGDLAALPGRTYAIGFARTYARAVGLDEAEIASAMRADLAGAEAEAESPPQPVFAPGDPARVPSARFAWGGALATGLAVIGGLVFWHSYSAPAGALPSLIPDAATPSLVPKSRPVAAAVPGGAVVFTATAPGIWVKFYDAAGKQLLQKQLAQGEAYTVPADAAGPMVWTGRPDALAITIGGHPAPPLATSREVIKDVPVSAAALLARAAPAAKPAVGSAPAPAAVASPAHHVHALRRHVEAPSPAADNGAAASPAPAEPAGVGAGAPPAPAPSKASTVLQ